MKKTTLASIIFATVAVTGTAAAYEKGDWIVRAGVTTVAPEESSSNILVGGANFTLGGP